jgi:hypothetical protein
MSGLVVEPGSARRVGNRHNHRLRFVLAANRDSFLKTQHNDRRAPDFSVLPRNPSYFPLRKFEGSITQAVPTALIPPQHNGKLNSPVSRGDEPSAARQRRHLLTRG